MNEDHRRQWAEGRQSRRREIVAPMHDRYVAPQAAWVEYIESQSFWGDVKIPLKTIPAVVSGRGAY